MSSWAIVALVAILIWGVVQIARAKAGIVEDKDGNKTMAVREDGASRAEIDAARRELEDLRERVRVLERIATDTNTGEARETARIAAEIEALRVLHAQKKEEGE
jgi:5-bromo-4-chloroindolyl phosphate hydrolysis protein